MAAMGQGGNGGAPGGAPGPAAAAAPGVQPGAEQQQPNPDDPYGFGQHVASAPEHLRPYVQTALDQLRPQLDQATQTAQQFAPLQERLTPLMEAADPANPDAGSILDALVELHAISSDPNRTEDFMTWWEGVGDAYGFWGDEPGQGGDGGDLGGDPNQPPGTPDPSQQDPRDTEIAALREQLQQVTQRLDGQDQQSAVATAQQQIQTELSTLMQQHQVQDNPDPSFPAEQQPSTVILRLASTYDGADAVQRGVADYLALTGQAQGQMVQQQAGQAVTGLDPDGLPPLVGAGVGGQGGGGHAAALAGGRADHEPEHVGSWKDAHRIALQRVKAAEAAGQF